jgi:hypothetical protein
MANIQHAHIFPQVYAKSHSDDIFLPATGIRFTYGPQRSTPGSPIRGGGWNQIWGWWGGPCARFSNSPDRTRSAEPKILDQKIGRPARSGLASLKIWRMARLAQLKMNIYELTEWAIRE